jgi:EAL and modified HD-GYP domain-containing signal transduction protein
VKLDVLGLADDEILPRVEALRPSGVALLAEKIETREQFESCRAMGFDYFQGFFLQRPSTVRKRSVDPQALTLLSLLNELHSPSFTFRRAEEIVKHDLGLCYRLLRHINSILFGMPRKITSVHEALVYLGADNVQNLTSLFLLAANQDTPREMITSAMVRGRMAECLARTASIPEAGQFFVPALFATLDAILGVPMDELLKSLPLSPPQEAALRQEPGPMTDVLRAVLAYERGHWDQVACLGLSLSQIKQAYVDALKWARIVAETESSLAA